MCEGEDSFEGSLFPAMWVPEIGLMVRLDGYLQLLSHLAGILLFVCVCVGGEEVMGSAAQNIWFRLCFGPDGARIKPKAY